MSSTPKLQNVPSHVAIIMDGNNRWAKQHKKGSLAGHRAGATAVRKVIESSIENGVQVLTLFAFSSENWKRPKDEVMGLMDLFYMTLNREIKKLHKNRIRINVIGGRSRFSDKLLSAIEGAESLTQDNDRLILNVAVDYGGRWDICQAAKAVVLSVQNNEINIDDIDEKVFGRHIALSEFPEPDLCIRTAGEQRVSNFLMWQFAYTEFYFSNIYWPEFGKNEYVEALIHFGERTRRFGMTDDQLVEGGE